MYEQLTFGGAINNKNYTSRDFADQSTRYLWYKVSTFDIEKIFVWNQFETRAITCILFYATPK